MSNPCVDFPFAMPMCIPVEGFQVCNYLSETYPNGCPKSYSCGCIVNGVCAPCPEKRPCDFIECGGTMLYADCGMIREPGFSYSMDCDACECIKIANPPTPTPTKPIFTPTPTPTFIFQTPTPTPTPRPTATPTPTPNIPISSDQIVTARAGGFAIISFSSFVGSNIIDLPTVTWQTSKDSINWSNLRTSEATPGAFFRFPGNLVVRLVFNEISSQWSGSMFRAVCSSKKGKYSFTTPLTKVNLFPPAARITSNVSSRTTSLGGSTSFTFEATIANSTGKSTPTVQWQSAKSLTSWKNVDPSFNVSTSMVGSNPTVLVSSLNITNASRTLGGTYFRALCFNKLDGYSLMTSNASLFVD